jgi:hypothetical protein
MEKRRGSPINSPAIMRVRSGVDMAVKLTVVVGTVRQAEVHGETEGFSHHGSMHPALV